MSIQPKFAVRYVQQTFKKSWPTTSNQNSLLASASKTSKNDHLIMWFFSMLQASDGPFFLTVSQLPSLSFSSGSWIINLQLLVVCSQRSFPEKEQPNLMSAHIRYHIISSAQLVVLPKPIPSTFSYHFHYQIVPRDEKWKAVERSNGLNSFESSFGRLS